MALPPTAMLREPAVPLPIGIMSVSPCTISTSSMGTPSSSATTCAKVVTWPCPCEWVPVNTVTLPEGCTRTVELS